MNVMLPKELARACMVMTLLSMSHSLAADTSISFGFETRLFTEDSRFSSQSDSFSSSLFVEPEFSWQSGGRDQAFRSRVFYRYDSQDTERTHLDVREFYYTKEFGLWELNAGINRIFWGVTESVHLVDVINQVDFVEDIDGEDRLGQPMLQLAYQADWGRAEVILLPYFRKRQFASEDGRFFLGADVSSDADYESGARAQHIDAALRYSHFFGDFDLGVHLFSGTNREPELRAALVSQANAPQFALVPYYGQMQQAGIDLQYTVDAWLFKVESLYRKASADSFFAAVAGFEYTVFQLAQSAFDLGLLLEYQFDDRDQTIIPIGSNNDLFLGARLAFNDIQDTSILAGVAVDLDTQEQFYNVEAERRVGQSLGVEARLRVFSDISDESLLLAFEKDDYFELELSWYF